MTFYYFADAYINFNSLVTELFKVYKTRIWMSAINPASFASVSPALHAPAGLGYGRQSPYRQQPDVYYNAAAAVAPPLVDGFQAPFVPSTETSPVEMVNGANGMPTNPFGYGFQPFGPVQQQQQRAAAAVVGPAMDGHAYGIPPPPPRMSDRPIEFRAIEFGEVVRAADNNHNNINIRRSAEHDVAGGGVVRRDAHVVPHEPWMSTFQGLSLGTH